MRKWNCKELTTQINKYSHLFSCQFLQKGWMNNTIHTKSTAWFSLPFSSLLEVLWVPSLVLPRRKLYNYTPSWTHYCTVLYCTLYKKYKVTCFMCDIWFNITGPLVASTITTTTITTIISSPLHHSLTTKWAEGKKYCWFKSLWFLQTVSWKQTFWYYTWVCFVNSLEESIVFNVPISQPFKINVSNNVSVVLN